jgi:hypothetical protein
MSEDKIHTKFKIATTKEHIGDILNSRGLLALIGATLTICSKKKTIVFSILDLNCQEL